MGNPEGDTEKLSDLDRWLLYSIICLLWLFTLEYSGPKSIFFGASGAEIFLDFEARQNTPWNSTDNPRIFKDQ